MRKVIASEFLSLDGVMEDPGGAEGSEYGGWSFAYFNEELGQVIGEGFAASDAMLMGRTTYEAWADFWPQQDPEENPDATLINGFRKYVVSTTLEEPLEWQNSTLIAGSASGHPSGETCPVPATFEREVRPRSDPRKEGEAMARSEIMQKIEDLSEERERLVAREGSHHADAGDHRRLEEIDHTLGVLWDLRRRELAGDYVGLDEDFLDRYVVSPGDDAPDDYRWAR